MEGDSTRRGPEQDPHAEQRGPEGGDTTPATRWEWIVGTASAVVVASMIGYLLVEAVAGEPTPPDITVRAESVHVSGDGYLVRFTARNAGDLTAASLMVEGRLLRDTVELEKSTATIDFVPPDTDRGGGLFFTRDPRAYDLELRPLGYDEP